MMAKAIIIEITVITIPEVQFTSEILLVIFIVLLLVSPR